MGAELTSPPERQNATRPQPLGASPGAQASRGAVQVRVMPLEGPGAAVWDAYVSQHPQGAGYHRLAWLQAVARSYGHRVFPLLAEVAAAGADAGPDAKLEPAVVGVLPLCALRKPWGRTEWLSLPFCDFGGPLADDETVRASLLAAALDLVRAQGGRSLDLRLPGPALPERNEGLPDLAEGDDILPAKVSMICPLPESSEALIKSYKPKLRSQIRKAEKNGLTSCVESSPEAIRAFYPVFAANMHRLGSPVHSLGWFLALQSAYGEQMRIGLVQFENQVVGAGIVLVNGQWASIPWASTVAEFNHLAPNMLLYWSLLADVTDRGCRMFDFGRSTPGEGTYRFKKQWGAEPHELRWLSVDLAGQEQPEPAQAPAKAPGLRALVERAWQRLPRAVADRLGPLLRKYISL